MSSSSRGKPGEDACVSYGAGESVTAYCSDAYVGEYASGADVDGVVDAGGYVW